MIRPDNRVHLEVSKPAPVGFPWPFVYTRTIGYVFSRPYGPFVVFQLMATMLIQLPAV